MAKFLTSWEKHRINAGWQCPECFGPFVSERPDRFSARGRGFVCDECGCQWPRQ